MPQCYRRNEMEKGRAYDERVREVEHGFFSPLVVSITGGMAPTSTVAYKRIASMIASKHEKPYSKTVHWIRGRLSFSLLRSAIMCLHGSTSALHRPDTSSLITMNSMDLACSEGLFVYLFVILLLLFYLFACTYLHEYSFDQKKF